MLMNEARWADYHLAWLEDFDNIAGWLNLTRGLLRRGSADDIRKILGANWLRMFARIWDGKEADIGSAG